MKTGKIMFYIIGVIFLVSVSGYFMLGNSEVSKDDYNDESGEFQKVVIGMKGFNYYPNTITVKEGIPVRIYLDESVVGCLRSFTIPEFGVAKYLKTQEDYVEFTPNKKGTFKFACSMNMGTGTLIVE
ncbi:cupredoxin domain-containing protein [Candidatus Pacearchaeota archaeon]|nr:cupredoxin domain-containing protein [Candidatus Pacearchaeota archaeon]